MVKQDKELLLKDLCGRLPYGVIGVYSWKGNEAYNRELTGSLFDELKSSWDSTEDSKFLPYLRPMSSMTEEEKKEYTSYVFEQPFLQKDKFPNLGSAPMCIDWLNKNMFDFRGLIPAGAAIEVTEENNPYKDEV